MQITTVDVVSANGKITKGDDDTHSWTSAADWKHFATLAARHKVFVMDDATYDSVQPVPEPAHLRIVITKHPKKYASKTVEGQLEFMDEAPEETIKRLEKQGHNAVLLVGKHTNAEFLAAGLVNEMYITIEPAIFGKGKTLLDYPSLDISLKLLGIEQLNKRGTFVAHYAVDR